MIEQSKNILTPTTQKSEVLALQKMINANVNNIRTSFLAKIVSIDKNRVSVVEIARANEQAKNPILNNVLVAQPKSGKWGVEFDLQIDDIGLCIVCDCDISHYQNGGFNDFLVNTDRKHDFNDSIFMPLSLYNQRDFTDGINFLISDVTKKDKIEFKDDILTLKAKLMILESENTTLKKVLTDLAVILINARGWESKKPAFHNNDRIKLGSWIDDLDKIFKA